MKIIAFIEERDQIYKILTHLGEPADQPSPAPFYEPSEWVEEQAEVHIEDYDVRHPEDSYEERF